MFQDPTMAGTAKARFIKRANSVKQRITHSTHRLKSSRWEALCRTASRHSFVSSGQIASNTSADYTVRPRDTSTKCNNLSAQQLQ